MEEESVPLSEEDYRELASFLEERLRYCQTPEESEELKRRLVSLYSGPLKEPLRATAQLEELLGDIEAAIARDPGDDELRERYVERARSLGAQIRAAECLSRVLKKIKAADVRERVGFDIGSIHWQERDLRQARSAFLEVVLVGAGGPLALIAAKRLLDPELHGGEAQIIGTALETIAKAESQPQAREEAAQQLLSIHESKPLKESRLLVAYQALVDSSRADEALGWLRAYYERKGDMTSLADVYRRQALRATDSTQARALALRSMELGPVLGDQERIEQWLWFVNQFGPDARAHASLVPLLEQAERWEDLCLILEADVELATPEQRAPTMARVGQIRLAALADTAGALAAFRRCLSLDPWNDLARATVEGLMDAGDSRLAAADVLEPVYRIAKFHEGELRVLETRAQWLAEPAARLAALAAAVDLAKGKLADPRRALQLCERALREAFAFASEAVLDWVVRLERVAALVEQPEAHAAMVLRLLGDGPLDSTERLALALSGIDALVAAGAPEQALALCERGLAFDPSSPDLLARADALVQGSKTAHERLARYEKGLGTTTDPSRRHSLMHAMAMMRRDALGDAAGAVSVWRSIVAEDPTDFAAYEALIDTTDKLGDANGTLDWIDRARRVLRGVHRHQLTLRKAQVLARQGAANRALDLCRDLVEKPDLTPAILQGIAQLAGVADEQILYGRTLQLLTRNDDAQVRKGALERYAEFMFEMGDRNAAVECWKAAALMVEEDPAEQDHARALYERALDAHPADVQAASQLIELYARSGDWTRLPAALRALIGGDDLGRCVLLLLRLEESAVTARAFDDFLALIDDLAGRLASASAEHGLAARHDSPEQFRALRRARARVLACDPTRQEEASEAFRALVEAFEGEEDVRAFASYIDSMVDVDAQRDNQRWLYDWRAAHSAYPADALLEWARAEEARGDSEAAIEVYQRLSESSGARTVALDGILRGAVERPHVASLWDCAERLARGVGSMDRVARAYLDALIHSTVEPSLAELLGRRMIALEEECALDPSQWIDALYRVLSLAPAARWALDRVKLALGALARWDELFELFDRAIDASPDEAERGELLYEAASAARDLAGVPERAIVYFESLGALRPDDAAVDGALERLYERQGRTVDLVDLLCRRLEGASGFQRRDLYRRVASLWLDIGDIEKAGAAVEQLLIGDAGVVDAIDLLERIVHQPVPLQASEREPGARAPSVHERAIGRLRQHYESLHRIQDVIRIAERSFALANHMDERAKGVRDLALLHVRAAAEAGEDLGRAFEHARCRVEAYLMGESRLAKVAYRALLVRAILAMRTNHAPAIREDAEDGAWAAIQLLLTLSMDAGDVAGALRLLDRCRRLPLARSRQRELLGTGAFVCSEFAQDPARAIDMFSALFEEDCGDEIASKSLACFSKLLEGAGRNAELAKLWEGQADVHSAGSNAAEERACWQRAAELWEKELWVDRAIAAHRRAAAAGSEASFEALARIHIDRREWREASKALEWLFARAPVGARSKRALSLAEAYVHLGERARARACLENALHVAGAAEDTEPIRKRLIELYREDEEWRLLAKLLWAEAGLIQDPASKLASLREAADLYRYKLGEPGEAAVLLEQAVSLDPHDGALRASLVGILEKLERWDQMVAALREQIDVYGEARSKDRALTHHRLGRTLLRAKRPEEALSELRLAAEMHPTHPLILHDVARTALQVGQLDMAEQTYRALLLALHRPSEESDPSFPSRTDVFVDLSEIALCRADPGRAADLVDSAFDDNVERGEDPGRLEEALRARGRDELLARALERRVQRGATLTDRAVALGDLARLWSESMGQPSELGVRIRQQAERIARDLAHEERADARAWGAICAACAVFEGKGPLEALLVSAIPRVPAGAERSQLRVMLARILLVEPERTDAAVTELSKALVDEPAGREAIQLLSEVLERHGRFDELVTLLEERLRLLSVGGEARDVTDGTWRYGRALELAGRVSDALSVYESLLEQELTDRELVRGLANRLDELGSGRLAIALEHWMKLDEDAAAEIAKRLAALYDAQGDAVAAMGARRRGFAAHPEDAELRERLLKGFEQRAEWGEAARVLDLAVSAHPEDAELLVLRAKVRERLSDYEGALTDLERASAINFAHITPLIELFTKMAGSPDSPGSSALAIRLVDALLRANRPKHARRELERLLARNPTHREALDRLASVAAIEGNWKSAAETNRKLLVIMETSSTPPELARVAVATADACERAGVLDEAREILGRVLETLAASPNLLPDLERLCQAMKDWRRLASVLVARAETEESAEAMADLLLRAGHLLLDEASDPAAALPLLDRVRSSKPDDIEVRLLCARAQVALGNAPEALKVLYHTLEQSSGKRPAWLSLVHLEIGRAHLALDELPEALFALESGFSADWRTGDIAMLLGLVAIDLGEEKSAERAFSAVTTLPARKGAAGSGADAAAKATAYYHLAAIAMNKGDVAKARRLAAKAVGADSGNVGAQTLLERLESSAIAVGALTK